MTLPFKQQLLTNNDCYKAGKKIKVRGLLLHSTGANNPKLSRYVGPDDGTLGKNPNGNHWNQRGIQKCVHGFIGLDKRGEVQAYQTLPWEHRAWGCGGTGNDTHIQVEICEDNLQSKEYFDAVYKKAVELFAHLALHFGLTKKDIIDHSEAHKLGIASNHGDVMHWFPKHGKSMDTFRRDVEIAMLGKPTNTQSKPTPKPPVTSGETKEQRINRLAMEVIRGQHGSGRERMLSLGSDYALVQQEVNRRLRAR